MLVGWKFVLTFSRVQPQIVVIWLLVMLQEEERGMILIPKVDAVFMQLFVNSNVRLPNFQ
jgi:hypothetical protein